MRVFKGTGFTVNADGTMTRSGSVEATAANVRALKQRAGSVTQFLTQLSDTLAVENRAMSAEENVALAHVKNLQSETLAALRDAERDAEAERNYRVTGPDPDAAAAAAARRAAGIPDAGVGRELSNRPRGAALTYRALFGEQVAAQDDCGPMSDPAEIFRLVGSRMSHPSLHPFAAGQGGHDAAIGGYALPRSVEMRIFDGMVPASIFLGRANVQPMTVRQQDVATFDRSGDGAAGTMFGFSFEFIPEGGNGASTQTASLRMISMTAHTGAILFDCSNEQLQDVSNFESGLLRAVQLAAGYGLDRFCMLGSGAGQPLGLRNQPALITISKETGQAADTINFDNLTKMYARMPTSSQAASIWIASPSCIPQLSTLTISVGTGGSHVQAMTSENGQFQILTRPVVFSDLCRPIGDAGDIMLVDFSQYTVGVRAGMGIESSQHVGFAKNRTTFRLLMRFDGNSGWDQAFAPEFSAPSQSPFIQLEAR